MDMAPVCPACGKAVVPDAPQGLCPQCLMKSGFDTRPPNQSGNGDTRFIPPLPEHIGRFFPQLEIIALLGQGGMGAVYKARQPALGRFVALKILPVKSAEDPGFAERFNREARALARLNHPNIVAVYDFGQAGGLSYFLMEYVEGATLRQVALSGRLSPRETLGIITQICEALQFAHDEGVVHRDIKPENILLDQKGRVKIADFGIAKVLNQEPQDIALTGDKEIIGTAHYMAPEQFEHPENVDHRADIFSLGVVFYELLTGELPLGKFAPPSQKVPADARLDDVVLHTLEREPDRRYQQASQVKADLAAIAATPGKAVSPNERFRAAARPSGPQSGNRPNGWKPVLVIGACGVAALCSFLCVVSFLLGERSKPVPAPTATKLASSNAFWTLLNDDQRQFVLAAERRFPALLETRTFDGWSNKRRADLEQTSLAILQDSRNSAKRLRPDEYYHAINTLGCLRSTNALPVLRSMAFEQGDTFVRSEASNRRRWMAARTLGYLGDKSVVPDLIHLLHHNYSYVRWWAQVSLVRLTGRNFGPDWRAWGDWWNSQKGQPFKPQVVRWWRGQPEPEMVAAGLLEKDRRFIAALKTHSLENQPQTEAEEPDDSMREPTR